MKLRTKYILFVTILHLVALMLSYFIFQDKVFFLGCEALIIVSILFAWQLYRQLIQPLKMLMQGVDAIKDRDFNIKFLHTGKHEMDQLIDVYNQMIDVLHTERTRQEQQHFFLEKLIHTSPTGIIILDFDERIHQVNPKALQVLDRDEKALVGKSIHEIEHNLFAGIASIKPGETKTIKLGGINTYKLQRADFIDRGFSRSFIMMEELTSEILAAEKNVYGKVIRMMAHEVNNTIGPVNSIMQSALKTEALWVDSKSEMVKGALQVALDRNQNLNMFMRNFADLVKLPEANRKQTDLHALVTSVASLMTAKAEEKNIKLQLLIPSEPYYIMADVQQMEQALINIVKNAIEAIGENGEVKFIVYPSKKQLIISDTGKGISAEQSEQLFTPFFSTKKDGQGIGLTLVREILANHGFEFSLKTAAHKVTEFTIWFD
jgi:nitrogen fixation/metabolism regulation signal transduction histidine kinase